MTTATVRTAFAARSASAGTASAGTAFAGAATSATRSPRLKITRRGRLVLSAVMAAPLVLAAVAVGVNAGGAVATSTAGDVSFEYETIDSGETLWHLAESVAPSADPRDVIADIMRLNGLETASVVPGQRVAIPTQYS